MTGKTKGPRVYNVILRPDAWAWKTKRTLEHPNSDMLTLVTITHLSISGLCNHNVRLAASPLHLARIPLGR